MRPEVSSPHSLKPANCPYPEPDQPSPCQISCRLPQLTSHRRRGPSPRLCETVRSNVNCYGWQLLAPRQTPKLEGHPLSAVRNCLFSTFADSLHVGGRSDTYLSRNSVGNWRLLSCRMWRRTVWYILSFEKSGYRPTAAFVTNQF